MHSYVLKLVEELSKELGYKVKGLGEYTATISYGDVELALHVDGVGTKTLVLQRLGRLRVAGWDCVAMNVNDVACSGAKPIALVDYIAMPKPDEEVFKSVVEGIVDAARYSRVAVLGGETAILPDLALGVDVVCTVLAVKLHSFANRASEGDTVVGVESWGLHANGYSLVRKILESRGIEYTATVKSINLAHELAKPTAIYSNLVLEAIEKNIVKSAAHITGGAYTKIRRVLPNDADIVLEPPEPPEIFKLVMELGNVPIEEMYKVFNMGIGLVVTTNSADEFIELSKKHGFKAHIIGRVVKGSGKIIVKTFNGKTLVY
jgi:phosphoribosylformylglycinamidine cyclo-ligase